MAVEDGHASASGLTRRRMLGGTAAALGAAAVMPVMPASGSAARMRIDIHRHMWPPAWAADRDRQGGWPAIGLAVPLPQEQLPHAGDPAPGLREVFNARDRARIEGGNALELLPNLAARIAAGR